MYRQGTEGGKLFLGQGMDKNLAGMRYRRPRYSTNDIKLQDKKHMITVCQDKSILLASC